MLMSCKHCGGIHQRTYTCPSKPKRTNYSVTYIDKFRWSKPWQRKRKYINARDKHLCQICLRLRHHTQTQYNFNDIEVHHIDPVANAWDRRLEDENLISLCVTHHKMAECGEISKVELFEIARDNTLSYTL